MYGGRRQVSVDGPIQAVGCVGTEWTCLEDYYIAAAAWSGVAEGVAVDCYIAGRAYVRRRCVPKQLLEGGAARGQQLEWGPWGGGQGQWGPRPEVCSLFASLASATATRCCYSRLCVQACAGRRVCRERGTVCVCVCVC